MREIGLHGIGGQGVVLAGELLANMYFQVGHWVQFMPSYGAERRGSPSNAYIRIDNKKILNRYSVKVPDNVIIFNINLLRIVPLKENGVALLNFSGDIKKSSKNARIFIVDANKIASDLRLGTPGMPIINTAMLGAFCRISGDYPFDTLIKVYEKKIGKEAKLNIKAAEIAFEKVREL